ncbi:helix-hairpin-helix domain-containing protein [Cyclobacteriaceae bacterium]|jgi:competence protein ComEA|nr:helix-hairpin-helix domain-containing protein [Cyclobacteriaceae bacterium]|tara:strand:+ start:1375 stop:2277 length:903 start_codon:yes stop_codon:yes gene_type:complete
MKKIRIFIINQLSFSRTEANGVIFLVSLIIIIFFFSWLLPKSRVHEIDPNTQMGLKNWSQEIKNSYSLKHSSTYVKDFELVVFDPNSTSVEDLKKIGFNDFIANRIEKYRQKGGYFSKGEDLKKIYGIDTSFIETILPYIEISERKFKKPDDKKLGSDRHKRTPAVSIKLDLNLADSIQLQILKGVGPILARRAYKFRQALGGFHDIKQLAEVYNMPEIIEDEIEKYFYLEDNQTFKLNINTDSIIHLSKHPYINWNLAKSIINYRKVHGSYDSIEQITSIKIISDSLYQKIAPYLTTLE